MPFWQTLEETSKLGHHGLSWLTASFALICIILTWALPNDRTRVRVAIAMYVMAMLGLVIDACVPAGADFAHKWILIASLFCLSAAMVTVGGILIFDVLLTAARLKPPAILCDILLAVMYIATALLVLSTSGVDVSGIVATSAVVTAVIGFSLQDTLGNIMGGMAIQMERSILVGDWIQVGDQLGMVKEIRWRQTSIETRSWDTIVIPNSVLMKSQVIVLGRRLGKARQHRMDIFFNVDYRYAPTQIIDAVTASVIDDPIPNVSTDPAPHCLLWDFRDSYAQYSMRFWKPDQSFGERTDSLVRCRIVFALKRIGVTIAIPAYRTFQTDESLARRDRIVSENLNKRLEAIDRVDLFHSLSPDERQQLAHRLHDAPFARGEAMAQQGGQAHCMYFITHGDAEVFVRLPGVGGGTRMVATLSAGDFFGEMGLMTGDVRSATVMAVTEVYCFRLDKDDFDDILRRRPEIAETISHILARRRVELEAAREHLTSEAMKQRVKSTQGDLLARIRSFFTLDRISKREDT